MKVNGHFQIIRNGLASFSWANNSNHSSFDEDRFEAFAYQGLTGTSYYLNNVNKNSDGTLKTVTINGHQVILAEVNNNFYDSIKQENIPCN